MVSVEAPSARPDQRQDRRAARQRVLLTGLVAYDQMNISFRCAIRNRSPSGAQLKLPNGMVVPDRFWLIDVGEGSAYNATAVWRRYPNVGVTLADPLDLKHAFPESGKRFAVALAGRRGEERPLHDPELRGLRDLWIAILG